MASETTILVRGTRSENEARLEQETRLVKETKAVRLRRLWRGRDLGIETSGVARGRPMLTAPVEAGLLPCRGLTARELIGMARAARAARRTEP